jgi:hypothetical protein
MNPPRSLDINPPGQVMWSEVESINIQTGLQQETSAGMVALISGEMDMNDRPRVKTLLLLLLGLDSLAVVGLWAVNLSNQVFPGGIWAVQQEISLPALHLAAEGIMAGVTLAGVVGTWKDAGWGRGILLFGLGMFAYSAVNSLGWAVVNDPGQGIPMVLTLVVIAGAAPYLIRPGRMTSEQDKQTQKTSVDSGSH